MRWTTLSMPDLILLVGTRVALGVGVGLLLAGRLDRSARIAAGCALSTVGVLTTIPLLLGIVGEREPTRARLAAPEPLVRHEMAGAQVP